MMIKVYSFGNLFSGVIIFLFSCLVSVNVYAQPALSLTPVIDTGLNAPIQFVNAGDGSNRVFIVQQGGTIRAYDASFNFLSTFLTVSAVNSGGERGLLSMAFHPDYATNGFFYVYYTNTVGNLELARYHISSNPNIADAASKVILISIPHTTNSNHNGGELHFGNDGFLYLSTGDGGGGGDVPNNAQNTGVLLGKMLRFNVNTSNVAPYYTIPSGNPYGNEIFDLGLRNPFRWSFDRATNDMWIGDVGQNSWEELNFRPAGSPGGQNFGWRCYEGDTTYNTGGCGPRANYVFPVFTYPTQSPAAITGGVVYRGSAYPLLVGYNISCDFYSGTFYKTIADGTGGFNTTTQVLIPTGIADFGETEAGEVYVVSITDGSVSRLIASGVVPVGLIDFRGNLSSSGVALNWQTSTEINVQEYHIEYSTDGRIFSNIGTVMQQSANGGRYNFSQPLTFNGTLYFRLKMVDRDGSYKYSDIIRLILNNEVKNMIAPSVISDGMMNVSLPASTYNNIDVINLTGHIVFKRNIAGQTGNIKIPLGNLSPGIYSVKFTGNNSSVLQKILVQ